MYLKCKKTEKKLWFLINELSEASSLWSWKPLTIITKSSTLDVAAVLDPPLIISGTFRPMNRLKHYSKESLLKYLAEKR